MKEAGQANVTEESQHIHLLPEQMEPAQLPPGIFSIAFCRPRTSSQNRVLQSKGKDLNPKHCHLPIQAFN